MGIKLGTLDINKLYLGETEINKAYLGSDVIYESGGADGSIADIVPDAVFDLDSTQDASYGGTGQTWANLVSNPSDGSSQTDYDALLGQDGSASTDDPTFVGTPGTAGAYFLHDGGDVFSLTTKPDLIKQLHWLSTSHTLIFCGQIGIATNNGIIGTGEASAAVPNMRILWQGSTSPPRVLVSRGMGGSFFSTIVNADAPGIGDTCLIVSHDAGTGNTTVYRNGAKFTSATQGNSVEDNSSNTLPLLGGTLNTSGGISLPLTDNTRSRAYGLIQRAITDQEAADLLAFYNTRHGGVY